MLSKLRLSSTPVPGLAYVGLAAMAAIFGHGALLLYRHAGGGGFALPSHVTLGLLLFGALFAGVTAAGHRDRARIEWGALAVVLLGIAFVPVLRPILLLGFLVLPFCRLRTFPVAQPYQLILVLFFAGLAQYVHGPDLRNLAIAFLYVVLLAHPHNAEAHPASIPLLGALESARRRAWEKFVAGFRILPAWARFGLLACTSSSGASSGPSIRRRWTSRTTAAS